MSGTNVESMAIKRYRRGKYVVATEKSLFSTSDLTAGAVQRLWSDAQTPYSACSSRRIGYNHCESPAMVAGATPYGKSQLGVVVSGKSYGKCQLGPFGRNTLNGKMGFHLLACVFVLGCQEQRTFTLNPDGSGKVVFETRMTERSAATPHDRLKWLHDVACQAAVNLDAWADARLVQRDGQTYFQGTGLFSDIDRGEVKTNVGGTLRPTWTVKDDGTAILILTKTSRRRRPADTAPADLTEEQIATKVKALRDRPVVPPFMTEKEYSRMRLEYTFNLPGNVVERSNFTVGKTGALSLTITGAKLLEAARTMKADEAVLRELVLAGEEKGGPNTDARIRRLMFGSAAEISATVKLTGKPQFDYAAAVAAAKKQHLPIMTRLGLCWTSIPKDMPLRFKSIAPTRIENNRIRVEAEAPRPFVKIEGGFIFRMTAADGTLLLPRIGQSQRMAHVRPPAGREGTLATLMIPIPAKLPAKTQTLGEVLGAAFLVAADTKTVDLGFSDIKPGAKGTALDARIVSVATITGRNGEEQMKIVVAAKTPKDAAIDTIRAVWPDGAEEARLAMAGPALLPEAYAGYKGREFVFRGALPTKPSFSATVWENVEHFAVPFRMTNVPVTNEAIKANPAGPG